MLTRGKILVQMALKATATDHTSDSRRTFTIRGTKLTETDKLVKSPSDQCSVNILQAPAAPEQHVEATIQHQHEQIHHSNEGLRSEYKQIVGSEENQDECEFLSESEITLDYDDDVRDPDWKAPDKTPSTDTDENNNILLNVDHEEVIEPQNTN